MATRKKQVVRGIHLRDQHLTLRGNLVAMECYEAITRGKDLFDAWDRLRARIRIFEETGKSKRLPAGLVCDLLWSFSATWRLEQGWDSADNGFEENPRNLNSYRWFADNLELHDFTQASPIILAMMLDIFAPPSEAGLESAPEDQDRPSDPPPSPTTGT